VQDDAFIYAKVEGSRIEAKRLRGYGGAMPSIELVVRDPQVTLRDFLSVPEGWRLTYKAGLANAWTQSVDLTTDHDFNDLEGTVAFEDADAREPYKGFAKGSLSYWKGSDDVIFPRPASWLATIRLPSVDLERLMKTVADGLPLASVNIDLDSEAEGIKNGWEPDGSGKKWDNAAHPALEITGFSLYFGRPQEEELVPDPPEPEIKTDVKVLEAVRAVARNTTYLIYAIIGLAVVIVWRHAV